MNKNANYGAGKWKATVLSCGTHMNYKGALSSGYDQELFIKLPYLAYLLQDGEMNILIDNGINERYVVDGKAWGGIPAWASSKDLLDSLAKHGLGPGDIDLVLYTHLHNDHAGNANLFPTTRSIAQKDEWENLLAPTYAELQRRDFDLDVVNTTQGLRIFVGDLFHMPCCCFPWMTEMPDCDGVMHKITPAADNAPSLRSSLVYDCYSYYESVDKIKALLPAMDPAYVVCGHDPALFPRS